MNTIIYCAHCGVQLHVAFWHAGKAFCDRHHYLAWQVAQDIKQAEEKNPQLTLHFTDDAALTTEQL